MKTRALTLTLTNACDCADDQGWPDLTAPTDDWKAGLPGAPGGAGFNGQWGYKDFYYPFFAQLTMANNGAVDMSTVANLATTSTEGSRVLFTEVCACASLLAHTRALLMVPCAAQNHDMASNQNNGRIPNIVDPNGNPLKPSYWAQKKSMLGMGVLITAPGIPMLFQGQVCDVSCVGRL